MDDLHRGELGRWVGICAAGLLLLVLNDCCNDILKLVFKEDLLKEELGVREILVAEIDTDLSPEIED